MKKTPYLPKISDVIKDFSYNLHFLFLKIKHFKRRTAFKECWNILFLNKIRQFIVLEGLRRTGKTILLQQIYLDILTKTKVNPSDLIYLKLDSPLLSGYQIQDYIEYFNKTLPRERLIYIFLDEIQSLFEWDKFLKEMFDIFPNIKIMATGSSSLRLNMKETGGTRWKKIKLNPLSFVEFIELKYPQTVLKNINYQSLPKIHDLWNLNRDQLEEIQHNCNKLWAFFLQYIFQGSYPESAVHKQMNLDEYQQFVFEKIYRKTMADILIFISKLKKSGIKLDASVFGTLFNKLIFQTGKEFSVNNFSKESGIKLNSLVEHLKIFEKANLFIKCPRVSPTEKIFFNVPSKYYLVDHTFYAAYYRYKNIDELREKKDYIYENLVFNHLQSVSGQKQIGFFKFLKREVDFTFFRSTGEKYLIECKSKKIDSADLSEKFDNADSSFRKICVNENLLNIKDNVLYIPITLFLLLEF